MFTNLACLALVCLLQTLFHLTVITKKSLTIVNCCSATETTRVRNQTENIQCIFVHHKYIISATIPRKPCSKNYRSLN